MTASAASTRSDFPANAAARSRPTAARSTFVTVASLAALVAPVTSATIARSAHAEEAPAFRETTLEGCVASVRAPDFPEVGSAIPCEIRFTARGDDAARFEPASLAIPTRPETLGVFDVLTISTPRVERGADGTVYAVVDVILSTLDAGTQTPEPLAVTYLAGGTLREGRVDFPSFPVKSLLGEDADPSKYRDILGEIPIAQRVAWWGFAGAALLLAIGGWLIWRLVRHDRREPLAPDAWALAELDRLAQSRVAAAGETGAFYDRLTAIVRGYASRRFEIPAERQTSREFLAMAATHAEFPAGETERLRALLRLADLVKFAAAEPDRAEYDRHLVEARTFVERTRSDPERTRSDPERTRSDPERTRSDTERTRSDTERTRSSIPPSGGSA
jgi:hypothetical protein